MYAAKYGHLHCLKYAHENGCPWDEKTCDAATRWDNIECLIYAFENGCRWDDNTALLAVHYDKLECFKFICKNGCNLDINICIEIALKNENKDFLSYIFSQHFGFLDNVLQQEKIQQYKTCICCVCLDQIVQIRFLPCDHKICCNECSLRLAPFNRCPICRGEIKKREALIIEDLQKLEDSNKKMSL
jgi:hypothetical protein